MSKGRLILLGALGAAVAGVAGGAFVVFHHRDNGTAVTRAGIQPPAGYDTRYVNRDGSPPFCVASIDRTTAPSGIACNTDYYFVHVSELALTGAGPEAAVDVANLQYMTMCLRSDADADLCQKYVDDTFEPLVRWNIEHGIPDLR